MHGRARAAMASRSAAAWFVVASTLSHSSNTGGANGGTVPMATRSAVGGRVDHAEVVVLLHGNRSLLALHRRPTVCVNRQVGCWPRHHAAGRRGDGVQEPTHDAAQWRLGVGTKMASGDATRWEGRGELRLATLDACSDGGLVLGGSTEGSDAGSATSDAAELDALD
ncbi:MAG: hypothetical protein COA68_12410 [Oceanobacter sp.]|nr:MAG: hypothetical protein COA68_12410 [Oceanobacter sp.]